MNKFDELRSLAAGAGVHYKEFANGHIQLTGDLLVNYYPMAKNRSCYVAGTVKAHKNITPREAIDMCFRLPELAAGAEKSKRKGSTKGTRKALFKKGVNRCYWCAKPLTLSTSTLEHIIPLSKGGLENANNRTLACYPCNQERGDKMPELIHFLINN